MKVLIIGNGFDLAHKLPTKYGDFLTFCKTIMRVLTYDLGSEKRFRKENIENLPFPEHVKNEIYEAFISREKSPNKYVTEFNERLQDNLWYRYFTEIVEKGLVRGSNWIDFEREIRDIIKYFDELNVDLSESYSFISKSIADEKSKSNGEMRIEKLYCFDKIVTSCFPDYPKVFSVKDLRERLYRDLRRLTRAFEIYIAHFVSQIECEKKEIIDKINPDYVISFNYSDTYSRVYSGSAEVYYIHGKAEKRYCDVADENYGNSLNECKMVLGIDEYWKEEGERAENVKYTIFKKYAQRILFGTGESSSSLLENMQNQYENICRAAKQAHSKLLPPNAFSNVYIFGHSLDVTDKDVLSAYIGAEFTNVDIYCKDSESEGELLANTVSLIEEHEVIKKVYSPQPRLRFIV